MITDASADQNLQKWGYRNAWLPEAWECDTRHITRWFWLTTIAEVDAAEIQLLTRVLGWDASPPPSWVASSRSGRVRIECRETVLATVENLLGPDGSREFQHGQREARRVQLPVSDWHSEYDATAWKLRVPVIAYELWPSSSQYLEGLKIWDNLSPGEKAAVGLPQDTQGYLCCLAVLIPEIRTFFHGAHRLIVSGDEELARTFAVYDETHDGPVTLGRVSSGLVPEPWPAGVPSRALPLDYVQLHYRTGDLASLSADLPETSPTVFRLPRCHHGLSGSDSTAGIIAQNGTIDICRIGLIRGLGSGYLTSEPWRARVAPLGFSAPARVLHVPPTEEAASSAFVELRKLGTPKSFCIADPYATADQLERLQETLSGARLLTSRKAKGITQEWLKGKDMEARYLCTLHDRFITGSRSAVLVGSSLNGLGKKHSFLVVVDAVMQAELARVFEDLWKSADRLHPP